MFSAPGRFNDNQTSRDRIAPDNEHDRDGGHGRPCGERRHGAAAGHDCSDTAAYQIRRQRGQAIIFSVSPAVLDGEVLAVDVSDLFETLLKTGSVKRRDSRDALSMYPITGIACCALAANGLTAAAPPRHRDNSRRRMLAPFPLGKHDRAPLQPSALIGLKSEFATATSDAGPRRRQPRVEERRLRPVRRMSALPPTATRKQTRYIAALEAELSHQRALS